VEKLLVKRNKANIFRIEDVVFYPGITEICGEAKIKKVRAHKSYQGLLKNKVMEEVTSKKVDSKEDEPTSDITEMIAKEAIAVVRETYAIPVLQDMHEREQDGKARATVLSAILDQIEEIKKLPEDIDGDED